jgi:hypothetical protein
MQLTNNSSSTSMLVLSSNWRWSRRRKRRENHHAKKHRRSMVRLMNDQMSNEEHTQSTASLSSSASSFSSSEFTIPTTNRSNIICVKKTRHGDHALDLTRALQDCWSLRDQDDPPTRPTLTRAPSQKKRDKLGDWTFRHECSPFQRTQHSASNISLIAPSPGTVAPNRTKSLPTPPSSTSYHVYPPANIHFHRQRSVKIFDQRDLLL